MKRFPQIDRFFTAVCSYSILALLILLTSCEKESLQDDTSRVKALKVNTAFLKTFIDYQDDCSSLCIEEGSETYYVKGDSKSVTSGINTKVVSYNAYNSETQFIVEVTFNIQGPANANADITIEIEGDIKSFNNVSKGATVSHAIDLPIGWQACDDINFSIDEEGYTSNDINFENVSYSLIGICSSDCEESFSYILNEDGSYTFTYISSEDLENADVKFT